MLSTVRKSRPLILITCHSTAAISWLTKKQLPIVHKMRRRKLIIRERMQDECHRFHRASAYLTVVCTFSNGWGIVCPAGFGIRIIIALSLVFARSFAQGRDTGSFTLDNSRVLAFRAGCET